MEKQKQKKGPATQGIKEQRGSFEHVKRVRKSRLGHRRRNFCRRMAPGMGGETHNPGVKWRRAEQIEPQSPGKRRQGFSRGDGKTEKKKRDLFHN